MARRLLGACSTIVMSIPAGRKKVRQTVLEDRKRRLVEKPRQSRWRPWPAMPPTSGDADPWVLMANGRLSTLIRLSANKCCPPSAWLAFHDSTHQFVCLSIELSREIQFTHSAFVTWHLCIVADWMCSARTDPPLGHPCSEDNPQKGALTGYSAQPAGGFRRTPDRGRSARRATALADA